MAKSQTPADGLIDSGKRVLGYAGVFGVLGFFLLPFAPIFAVTGAVAIGVGAAGGAAIAVKTDKK